MLKMLKEVLGVSKLPVKEFVWSAGERTKFSPDIAILEQYELQLLFVVDDLQSQFQKHRELISDGLCASLGHAFTRDKYQMWKTMEGADSYPIPIRANPEVLSPVRWVPQPAFVKGELFAVRPYIFPELDTHRKNGVEFQRRRVRLNYPYRELIRVNDPDLSHISRTERKMRSVVQSPKQLTEWLNHTPSCWMYSGREEFWNEKLGETSEYESLYSKVRMFEPKTGGLDRKYYQFTRYEIK